MSKSLSARIAELETVSTRAKNRAAFLAVRDEVKQAIDDGWPVKAIWRTLRRDQKIAVGYVRFPTQIGTQSDGKSTPVPIEIDTRSDANRHPCFRVS